jgi:hypothetical protein
MEMKFRDGDYVPNVWGGFETVSGADELMQRLLFKLTARRGAFPFLPELGSRLYLLAREKPSTRKSAAEMYVREALSDESDITLLNLELTEDGDGFLLKMSFEYEGEELTLSVSV